jgi:hypothetical protein
MRRLLALLAGVAAGVAGALLLRNRVSGSRDRADLYFEDGSLVTVADGAPDAERILRHARDLLAAARG